jgi:exodeoxyribonuclease VII small subunit
MVKKNVDPPIASSFEEAMQELEQIVSQVEQSSTSLEQTLISYERGMKLLQFCKQSLQEAEGRIKVFEDQFQDSV